MKNDKERRDYINNPENWILAFGSGNIENIRTMVLTYKDERWARLEVYREYESFDFEKLETVKKKGWVETALYAVSKDGEIGEPISKTQIMNRMKELDRKERTEE